jgi:hypothetical protein
MATIADLAADNENLAQQLAEWREMRAGTGDAADDWGAFRQHLTEIGAPDPGEEAAEDFTA